MGTILGTVDGKPVAQTDIDAIVANAEAGFPGVTVRSAGRPAMGGHPARTVAVRLEPELDTALLTRLAETGETVSDLMRAALRQYLNVA